MTTELIVCLIITVFLAAFQWGVSRLMKKPEPTALQEYHQYQALRMWGFRSVIFAAVFVVVLFLRQDDLIFVMLVYVALSVYNSSILKRAVRKIRNTYPPAVVAQAKKEITPEDLLENPLDFAEEDELHLKNSMFKEMKDK